MIPRYCHPDMNWIWTESARLDHWRQVELAWLRQMSPNGYDQVKDVPTPSASAVAFHEAETRHEFTAFLAAWQDQWDEDTPNARQWVHFGLTSSDVIDTATAMQLTQSNSILIRLVRELRKALNERYTELYQLEQVGRTHGQWAQPRSAANPIQNLGMMLHRQEIRLRIAGDDLPVGDFSGPTGGRQNLSGASVGLALRDLGLIRELASTQILPRDSWVHWAHIAANTVTVCEAIADHYWFLAQSEVGEVTVGQPSPSSAMPHKRNPALAENVRGLGRMARHYASMLDESIVQRGDRDLAHSSVERIALPDLCHLAATALERTTTIVQTYEYDTEQVEAWLRGAEMTGDARSHERVTKNVLAGMSREEAMNSKENP